MPGNPERVFTVCQQLLAAVVARHGGDLPERRLVTPGLPAWDCPLVATWCEVVGGYEGNPNLDTAEANRRAAGWAMRVGTFVIEIVRNAAAGDQTGSPPPAAELEADARALYTDSQRTVDALVAAAKADELPGCGSVVFLGWTVTGPEGGLVGSQLRVRVGLALV